MPSPIAVDRIEKLVEDYLEHQGYELVDIRVKGSIGNPVLEIYCDIEGGITAEDCGKISRSLRFRLIAEGYLDDSIGLIVSSPGLDRIIKKDRDFQRFIGKKVTVWLHEKIGDRKKISGVLAGYDNGTINLAETEEGHVALSFGLWKEVRLVPEYPDGFK
ncbi:MAG TPA: ribosome maturation factor RimP [bacterium]|jgi:ribosome maturation factor RimP